MSQKPHVFICSPSRGDKRHNLHMVKEYNRQVYELGYIPVSPHLQFAQFLDMDIPEERMDESEMSLSILRRCRLLVICGDTITDEMVTEISLAVRLGIVITTLEGLLIINDIGKREG